MRKKISSTVSFLTMLIIAAMTMGLNSCNNDPVSPENEYPEMPEYVSGGIILMN